MKSSKKLLYCVAAVATAVPGISMEAEKEAPFISYGSQQNVYKRGGFSCPIVSLDNIKPLGDTGYNDFSMSTIVGAIKGDKQDLKKFVDSCSSVFARLDPRFDKPLSLRLPVSGFLDVLESFKTQKKYSAQNLDSDYTLVGVFPEAPWVLRGVDEEDVFPQYMVEIKQEDCALLERKAHSLIRSFNHVVRAKGNLGLFFWAGPEDLTPSHLYGRNLPEFRSEANEQFFQEENRLSSILIDCNSKIRVSTIEKAEPSAGGSLPIIQCDEKEMYVSKYYKISIQNLVPCFLNYPVNIEFETC